MSGHEARPRSPERLSVLRVDGAAFDYQRFTRDLSERYGIQARGGCACAGPYVHRLLQITPGQSAALRLANSCRVALVSKRALEDSASGWAQGGIAAVLDSRDSIEAHIRDTITAGAQ